MLGRRAQGQCRQKSCHGDPVYGTPTGPSWKFLFGVDPLGEDVFSRVLYGARVSLEVALVATGLSVTIGVALGMLAGYFRGLTDTVISRVIDLTLAFPILLLALWIASACSLGNGCVGGLVKPGLPTVIAAIVVINWTYIGRLIRVRRCRCASRSSSRPGARSARA